MAEKYDSNGDYSNTVGGSVGGGGSGSGAGNTNYSTSDFKRKKDMEGGGGSVHELDLEECDDVHPASSKVNDYISELLAEKQVIDLHKFHNAARLLDQELTKVQTMNRLPAREYKYVDIYRERPIKVAAKVLVPVREHPKFNFVGKLLGPKGNTMKRLQEETMCKMAVLGRGSMRDRQKEEELRTSCDPKYAHLSDDLHVEISALGPPAEAHARVAFALAEVRKYLVPDNNDNIRQEQMREMDLITGMPIGEPMMGPSDEIIYKNSRRHTPHVSVRSTMHHAPIPMRTATRTPVHTPRVMPAKTKILSILDRARIAMEESYAYDESENVCEEYETPIMQPSPYRGQSSYYRGSTAPASSSHHSYEPEYENQEYYRESSSAVYDEPSSQRWKYKSSSASSSRHAESSGARYRSSPYSRPSK